ncbi:hypothetical protein K435DRAFT_835813 [Dendrothele bispora CBS 962.96]|uniref:Uncharacterized protein n=1 Tax=Dendrothele bispora (strain CBS 962.96) TaxID=1314807 RepID=A0A4S8ML11_DENBC|nr:hypothetical protein K435DRAFT_835813 [Dendrothele bispora CBS 962.96]
MATTNAILSNARYHAQLVERLDSLQSAPEALEKQAKSIAELQSQVEKAKQRIEELRQKTTEKKKQKNSSVKKIANKVIGREEKFTTKVEKEEREYVEALETEVQERGRLSTLENTLTEAKRVNLHLESQVEKFSPLQKDLSSLYSRVFTQPTTLVEFPQLTEAEIRLKTAQYTQSSIQEQSKANEHAAKLLGEAEEQVRVCLVFIDEGLTQYGTWGGKDVMAEIGRELRSAKRAALKAEELIAQAKRSEPQIESLSPLVILGNTTSEDGAKLLNSTLLAQINNNRNDIVFAQEMVKSEIRATASRIEKLKTDLVEAGGFIRKAEKELQSARREVWDAVVSGQSLPSRTMIDGREAGINGTEITGNPNARARMDSLRPGLPVSPPSYDSVPIAV